MKDLNKTPDKITDRDMFTSLLDSFDAVVYVADMKTYEILYINKYTQDIFGDITGKICWQTLQTDQDGPCGFCTNDKLLKTDGKPLGVYHWEFQNTLNNKWYDVRDRAIKWIDGRMVRLEIATDITHRKNVEEAMSVRENLLIEAQKVANIGHWDWDIINNTESWSQETYNIFGVSQKNFTPSFKNFTDFIHPDDRESVIKAVEAGVEKDKPVNIDYRIRLHNGTERILNSRGKVYRDKKGKPIRMTGSCHDITERKKAEEEFNNIFNLSADMICIADINGYFKKINPAWEKTLGYTNEELLSKPFMDYIHPDDRENTLTVISEKLSKGITVFDFENRYRCKDGTYKWLLWTSNPIVEKGITYAIATDITKRKKTEETLLNREKQLAESQRIAQIGSWEHNLTTGEVTWSDELFRLLGLDPRKDPADFKIFFDMIHPDDRLGVKKAIDETLQTGNHFSVDYRFKLPNGRSRVIHAQAQLITNNAGDKILSGTGHDITNKKQEEVALEDYRKQLEQAVLDRTIELDEQKTFLAQKNVALGEIIGQIELEKNKIKDNVLSNIEDVIMPLLYEYRSRDTADDKFIDLLEQNLQNITSPFGREITGKRLKLSRREIEICNAVEKGLTNKQIANLLSLSVQTIESYRQNIRKKLGIAKKKINLAAYLNQIAAE